MKFIYILFLLFLIISRAEANVCSNYFINNFDYKYETIISNIYNYQLNSFDLNQITKEKEYEEALKD